MVGSMDYNASTFLLGHYNAPTFLSDHYNAPTYLSGYYYAAIYLSDMIMHLHFYREFLYIQYKDRDSYQITDIFYRSVHW